MLIQYTGWPSIFIPACVFVWGGISTSTGAVKSFGPALVVSLWSRFGGEKLVRAKTLIRLSEIQRFACSSASQSAVSSPARCCFSPAGTRRMSSESGYVTRYERRGRAQELTVSDADHPPLLRFPRLERVWTPYRCRHSRNNGGQGRRAGVAVALLRKFLPSAPTRGFACVDVVLSDDSYPSPNKTDDILFCAD